MKKKILNNCIKNIKTNKPELNEEQIEIIEYGLESIYLTITKIVVIVLLSIVLNIFKETILMILFYNIIRLFAFGLHTKNSTACLFTSISLFIFGAFLAIYLKISIGSRGIYVGTIPVKGYFINNLCSVLEGNRVLI